MTTRWRRRLLGKRSILWLVIPARCINCGHREALARWHRAWRCKDVMRCAQRARAKRAAPMPAPLSPWLPEPVPCAPTPLAPGAVPCAPVAPRAAPAVDPAEVERAWALGSAPGDHAASCARKIAYGSFGEALTAIRWLRDKDSIRADQRRAYRCLACGDWHTTSKPFTERKSGETPSVSPTHPERPEQPPARSA